MSTPTDSLRTEEIKIAERNDISVIPLAGILMFLFQWAFMSLLQTEGKAAVVYITVPVFLYAARASLIKSILQLDSSVIQTESIQPPLGGGKA